MAENPQNSSSGEQQQTGAMFGNNILIQGGHFVQHNQTSESNVHNCNETDDGFKHLLAHVAPTAWTTQYAVDAPKCHTNTRTAVLNDIMSWVVLLAATRAQWILWMNGAAGAGKSAIARSIVDLCLKQQIVVARFFFFRTDPSRNNLERLVPTLAYQLIQQIPALEALIAQRIRSHPLVFTESLESQFDILILDPLFEIYRKSPPKHIILLLFDGVDECIGDDDQANLIRVMIQFVEKKSVPLIALFSSRPEPQITAEFQSSDVSRITRQLALDAHYLPDADIRLFFNDGISRIWKTHQFKRFLEPNWPGPALVDEIVNKSSGQFIYAAVVMRFISTPHRHPAQQLDIVRGLHPAGDLTPFAQLDALYQHILSQVEDRDHTTLVLAFFMFGLSDNLITCSKFLGIPEVNIHVALASLASIINCDNGFHFLHASLSDFLRDPSRSQQYFIDRTIWSTKLLIIGLDRARTINLFSREIFRHTMAFLYCAEGIPALQDSLTKIVPYFHNFAASDLNKYIEGVKKLNFGDGGKTYLHQLDAITSFVEEGHPGYSNVFRLKSHWYCQDVTREEPLLRRMPWQTRYIAHNVRQQDMSVLKNDHEIAHTLLEVKREREESQTQAQAREKRKGGKREAGKHDAVQEQWNAFVIDEQQDATITDVKDVGQHEEDEQGDVAQTAVRSNGQDSAKEETKVPKSSFRKRMKSKLLAFIAFIAFMTFIFAICS